MIRAAQFKSIVVLTGAGISAESGIKTFRDNNGLWENQRFEDVATPEAFATDADLVHRFYNQRRMQLIREAQPNAAHIALANFERSLANTHASKFTLITQNVDDLHERAGCQSVVHMHGELLKIRCSNSGEVFECREAINSQVCCECCKQPGLLRPHIVWFGETPFFMEIIERALQDCDLFVAVGTSAQVYPAAGFMHLAKSCGAATVELNLASTTSSHLFDHSLLGPATQTVTKFFETGLDQKFF
ncbi:NAD-dependent deacetylase [Alteromonadaceae bacterium 2753L.S.0a.02]|nr:NAD-dependent deacetylase [Alteromonadaceae bacterium 2753L.S.0a.02]